MAIFATEQRNFELSPGLPSVGRELVELQIIVMKGRKLWLVRHGERVDHVDKIWKQKAENPYVSSVILAQYTSCLFEGPSSDRTRTSTG